MEAAGPEQDTVVLLLGAPSYQHRYKVLPQPGMEPTKDSLQASSQGDAGGMLLCSQLRGSVTVTCTWLNNPNTVASLTISWNGDMFCCRGMIYRRWTCAKIEAGSQHVPTKDILALLCCPLQVDPEDPWPWTIRLAPTQSEITRGSGRDYLQYERARSEYPLKIYYERQSR